MMTLYSADLSPYSARVRMQIYAKGITDIAFEQPADWGMPKFREKFPIGRVPVLDIDGDLVPESEVIAEYLEEIFPSARMGSPAAVASRWRIARSSPDSSLSKMSCLSSASTRRFRQLQMSPPIGPQSRRTSMPQKCCSNFTAASKSAVK